MNDTSRNAAAMHRRGAHQSLEALRRFGLSPDCQQRIGALFVLMAILERTLEQLACSLPEKEPRPDGYPVTPGSGVAGKGIAELAKVIQLRKLGAAGPLKASLTLICDTAPDLAAYRNAIAHGWLVPDPLGGQPYFVKNSARRSQAQQRLGNDAHISMNLLDMALDAALSLVRAAQMAHLATTGARAFDDARWNPKLDGLRRARSSATELRYLTELMNHELY